MVHRNEIADRTLRFQPRGVPTKVISHEGGDKVITVIIAALETEGVRDSGFRARRLQQFWAKLLHQERICIAAVDQEIGRRPRSARLHRACAMPLYCHRDSLSAP